VVSRYLIGIDTGGTFTDAVVYDELTARVVAKAKAPTTYDDLSLGIAAAVGAVLVEARIERSQVELVCLSTTLATNALVEGRGGPVAAVMIGFEPSVIDRGGLVDAIAGDPVIVLPGGHDSHGYETAPLDLAELARQLDDVGDRVDAYAVTAQFSVRNATHEQRAATFIRERTGRPVTCSYQLSAKLNGPRRAVTAILNARLVAVIDDLVAATEQTLSSLGVSCPLMMVRGDGSLVSAAYVRDRPIETILSGPAASLIGAAHLSGVTDAVISDIGGTTTDIAVLQVGLPLVSESGATVGGHQTMVTAVAMDTVGLGGDSEVLHDERAASAVLIVGPRRVVPLCVLALTEPELVRTMLQTQLSNESLSDLDGVVLLPVAGRLRRAASPSGSNADGLVHPPAPGSAARTTGSGEVEAGVNSVGSAPTDDGLVATRVGSRIARSSEVEAGVNSVGSAPTDDGLVATRVGSRIARSSEVEAGVNSVGSAPGDAGLVATRVGSRIARSSEVDAAEAAVLTAVGAAPTSARAVARTPAARRAVARLIQRGLLRAAAYTPTDAAHVVGWQTGGDAGVAMLASTLFARRRDRLGRAIANDGQALAEAVVATLIRQSVEAVLGCLLQRDGLGVDAITSPVVQAALDGRARFSRLNVGLGLPLVALGAGAATYYPRVAELLQSPVIIPEHAEVANAVGAVVGRVRLSREVTVSSLRLGQFAVQLDGDVPFVTESLDAALAAATTYLGDELATDLANAGAADADVTWSWVENTVDLGGTAMFIEGILIATGSGRPQAGTFETLGLASVGVGAVVAKTSGAGLVPDDGRAAMVAASELGAGSGLPPSHRWDCGSPEHLQPPAEPKHPA
jgi:N-methylhydantoinase A/oxoprolinase/acetone carboxylase beta subunit